MFGRNVVCRCVLVMLWIFMVFRLRFGMLVFIVLLFICCMILKFFDVVYGLMLGLIMSDGLMVMRF